MLGLPSQLLNSGTPQLLNSSTPFAHATPSCIVGPGGLGGDDAPLVVRHLPACSIYRSSDGAERASTPKLVSIGDELRSVRRWALDSMRGAVDN